MNTFAPGPLEARRAAPEATPCCQCGRSPTPAPAAAKRLAATRGVAARRSIVEQVEDRLLDRSLDRRRVGIGTDELERGLDRLAVAVAIEDARVDVGVACDRRRVAEIERDLLHGSYDRALARRPAQQLGLRHRETDLRQHRRPPRAELLRGDVDAGRRLEVGV